MSKGFTMLEVVVVIALAGLLIGLSSSLLIVIFSGSNQQNMALDNIDNARITSLRFVNEIRSSVPGADGSAPISSAGDSQIIFYTYRIGQGDSVKRVRYFVSEDILYKGVVEPAGNPLAYDLGSESVSIVQRDLALAGSPLFYYYNGDYDGQTPALAEPVNINNIKYVRMNLKVLKQTTQGSESIFSFSAGAAIRSLKDNLGE